MRHSHAHAHSLFCFVVQELEDNIDLTKVKIIRAEKLISGLGGEKERWTNVSQSE